MRVGIVGMAAAAVVALPGLGEELKSTMSDAEMQEIIANAQKGGGMGADGFDMGGMGGMEDMMGGMGDAGGMGGDGGMDMEAIMQQMQGMGGTGFGGPSYEAEPRDVKFIICDTCKAMVSEGLQAVRALRAKLPNTKISEERIDSMLEKMCDPKAEAGHWINFYDMVEKDDRIVLEKQPEDGVCKAECLTVGLACERISEEISSDLVEKLYLDNMEESEMVTLLCQKMLRRKKGACGKKYPPIPADRDPGMPFEAKTEEQRAMDEINRKIKSTPGLGSFNMGSQYKNEL